MKDGTVLIVLDEDPDKLYRYIPTEKSGCDNCVFQGATRCGELWHTSCGKFFSAVSGERGYFEEVK